MYKGSGRARADGDAGAADLAAPTVPGGRPAGWRSGWRRLVLYVRGFAALTPDARLLVLANLALNVGLGVAAVLFNVFLVAAGHDLAFVGLVGAITTVTQAVAAPLIGRAIRHAGERPVLAAGAAAWASGTALAVTLPYVPTIMLGAGLSGLGFAAATIPTGPLMIALVEERQRVHLFSAYFGTNTIGGMVGSLLAGVAPALAALLLGVRGQGAIAGDRVGLLLGAAIAMCGVALFWRINPYGQRFSAERPLPADWEDDDRPERRLAGDVTAMLVATGLIAAALGATMPFIGVYFSSQLHASTATLGVIFALSGLVCTAASALSPVAGRWGTSPGFNATRLLSAPLLLLFVTHPALALAAAAYIGRNALGTVSGALENVFAMEVTPARSRAIVAGWRGCAFNAGWSLGALATGAIAEHAGYDPIFAGAALLTAVGTAIYYARFAPPASVSGRIVLRVGRAAPIMPARRWLGSAWARLS